jgi:hypothetical protein
MGDWPRVVGAATVSMGSNGSLSLPNGARVATAGERLSSCFQAVCRAMGGLHQGKIVHNFAAAAFHLCYLLQVRESFIRRGFVADTPPTGQSLPAKR